MRGRAVGGRGYPDLPNSVLHRPVAKPILKTLRVVPYHRSGLQRNVVDVPTGRCRRESVRLKMETDLHRLSTIGTEVHYALAPAATAAPHDLCQILPAPIADPDLQLPVVGFVRHAIPVPVLQARRLAGSRHHKLW